MISKILPVALAIIAFDVGGRFGRRHAGQGSAKDGGGPI